MSQQSTEHPIFGTVISTYTRAQAIEDGVLVDAGPMAQEAGLRWPVAITATAWIDSVAWSEPDSLRQVYQDQSGRLWDVLFMAAHAIRRQTRERNEILFRLYRVPRDGQARRPRITTLKLVIGPGDDGEPVITILLPGEN
jgi:hypothetical protein